jgi:hypothetical protein
MIRAATRAGLGLLGLVLCLLAIRPIPAGADAADPRALGTLTLLSTSDPTCPSGFACQGFEVTCPGIQASLDGFVAEATAVDPVRGVVLFFSGGSGTSWWTEGSSDALLFMTKLTEQGLMPIQVRWTEDWEAASAGEQAGPATMACRPATVIDWSHEALYLPLGLQPVPESCGFCVTGNSGGASAVMYGLAFYGLDGIVDVAVPTSGPPHAALAKGCLGEPADYAFPTNAVIRLDSSYGYLDELTDPGPCIQHDASFTAQWDADSVDLGGDDYVYETSRVHFILGGLDDGAAPVHAEELYAKLVQSGSPFVSAETVPTMGHRLALSVPGLKALLATLAA